MCKDPEPCVGSTPEWQEPWVYRGMWERERGINGERPLLTDHLPHAGHCLTSLS